MIKFVNLRMRRIAGPKKELIITTATTTTSKGPLLILFITLTPIAYSTAAAAAGILDPWQWTRSDKIEVNIPWLPCMFNNYLHIGKRWAKRD